MHAGLQLPTDTHTPRTRILQRALARVVAHAVHTDAPIGTRVLHTVVGVHPAGRSFKASQTGAPVGQGRRERRVGPWPERQPGTAAQYHPPGVSISSSRSFHPYSRTGPRCMPGVRGEQDQPCTRGTHTPGGMMRQGTRGEAEDRWRTPSSSLGGVVRAGFPEETMS